jgi:hypothetical protein
MYVKESVLGDREADWRIILKVILNNVRVWNGSTYGPVANTIQYRDEPLGP